MSLRIGMNARLLADSSLRGWNRYTVNLVAELSLQGVDLVLYSDHDIHPNHLARLECERVLVRIAPPMRYTQWEQFWLPKQCGIDGVDVLHSPFNFSLPWSCPCPCVLTLHDAIDSLYYGRRQGLSRWAPREVVSRLRHWSARIKADAIITVSEHARHDLIDGLGLPASKIHVISEAADPLYLQPVTDHDRQRVARKYKITHPYLFYVGGWEQRKNIPFLLHGFAQANLEDVELILAGGRDEQRSALLQMAVELGISKRVRLLGWVDEEDLPSLYAQALGFCYPSEYEGFGLQICEAMAVGCPVLAARATCLPEVLGSGGETFTLDQPGELAELLRRLGSDAAYRTELQRRARTRSADFSWARAAFETIEVYRSLIHEAACEPVDQS